VPEDGADLFLVLYLEAVAHEGMVHPAAIEVMNEDAGFPLVGTDFLDQGGATLGRDYSNTN